MTALHKCTSESPLLCTSAPPYGEHSVRVQSIGAFVHICAAFVQSICAEGFPALGHLETLDGRTEETPAHAQTLARPVGIAHAFRLAIRSLTNGFVIRDSAKASNRDKHLAAPSNHSLTAVGACSVRFARKTLHPVQIYRGAA